MTKSLSLSFLLATLFSLNSFSQVIEKKKSGQVIEIQNPPKIDGVLDEECWLSSNLFTDFRQYEPYSGENSRMKTVVRLLYDNDGIYVGAMNYDSAPDSIRKELGRRDGDRDIIADYFNIDLGPYNDGINGYSFKLTASGVQSDIRRSSGAGGRDLNWDAVWHSAVSVVDSGWVAEIKIPFSAIRFPKDGLDSWGLNFWRYIQRYGEWSSWNYADKSHGTTINYMGEINGITGVKPPLRISLTPYVSAYLQKATDENGWDRVVHGGADLKVGLTEAFTLDATLIPDFGQVQSDDQVLNLSPYEVKYNERRQFFTEGTDVFNKGGIFYSRRVGSRPSSYSDAYRLSQDWGLELISNPQETRLINATKVSGRTENGLGIGFFNGLTAEANAEMLDTNTAEVWNITTQPLTNYNMLVVDQNLGGGSYISLANTNVMRMGSNTGRNYTANVTAADMRYLDPSRTWSASGVLAISQKYYSNTDDIFGHSIRASGGKTGGAFRAYVTHDSKSKTYDPNDMGYLRRNNEFNNSLTLGYNIYKPVGNVLNSLNSISFKHEMLYLPRTFTSFSANIKSATTFKNLWVLTLTSELTPISSDDYYEPRVDGFYYSRPASAELLAMLTTDNRRALSLTGFFGYNKFYSDYDMQAYKIFLAPLLRINNQFSISHSVLYNKFKNDIGYAAMLTEGISFGKRDARTIENIFTTSFIFNSKSYLDIRVRHYWSMAEYKEYFLLQDDGGLTPHNTTIDKDINTNFFNVDASFTWRFAPGSEMKIVWKNSIYQSGPEIFTRPNDNFNALFDSPGINSFSLKVLYYLDYHTITKM